MEQALFRQLLTTLGHWKIRKDTKDEIFIPTPTSSICPHCEYGWEVWIEKKWGYKDKTYWRYKCRACKESWQENTLKLD